MMESILIFVVMIGGLIGVFYLGWLITKDPDDTWNRSEETDSINLSCVICKEELVLWEAGESRELWKCEKCYTEQIFRKNPKTGNYLK